MDLSGMADLSGIRVDLPDLPSVSLETLLKDLDLNVSSEGFSEMARSLIEGYRQYAAEHPEADYSASGGFSGNIWDRKPLRGS